MKEGRKEGRNEERNKGREGGREEGRKERGKKAKIRNVRRLFLEFVTKLKSNLGPFCATLLKQEQGEQEQPAEHSCPINLPGVGKISGLSWPLGWYSVTFWPDNFMQAQLLEESEQFPAHLQHYKSKFWKFLLII